MAYIQQTIWAGVTVEVIKYEDRAYGKRPEGGGRRKKWRKTPEDQIQRNEKRAEDKLRWKLNAGCSPGDYHVVLTYEGENPKSEDARHELKRYLDRTRRLYKKHGAAFQWLAVSERGERSGRVHHHIIMKKGKGIEPEQVSGLWKRGFAQVRILTTKEYSKLASYLIKYTSKTFRRKDALMKRRWTCSRNWPKPKIVKKVVRRSRWVAEPRPYKGYVIAKDKTHSGETDGFAWQRYTMIKIE